MKQLRHRSILLACLLILGAASLLADATTDARKEIQDRYNRENGAAMKKDAEGLLAYTAPDYVHTDKKGNKMKLEQMRQMMPQLFAITSDIKAKTTITKITVKGKQAKVAVSEHAEMMMTNPQTQKQGKVVADSSSQDVWMKTGKGWMKKSSKTLTERATFDGKPMPGA